MQVSRPVALHRHPKPHRELARRYRHYARQQEFRISILLSVLLFAASVAVIYYAIGYATESASGPVTDIILSNTPAFDVDGLFAYGTLGLVAFIALLLLAHPKRIPFTLHAMSLLYFIRAAFVSITHIGSFPIQAANSAHFGIGLSHFLFGGDLFFSGHTALAFLLALIFWREKKLRYIFLAWSLYMAVVVLLGHLHYSIDVASAFFITYTIYRIAEWLFPKDRGLFYSEILPDE